jgi:two-component system chemotaxis sensor kinase CheA
MIKDQDAFLLELLGDFKIEAAEHQQAIVSGLLELEKNPAPSNLKVAVETVFREIHSLKGAARAVNQLDIERLCMGMESVFHQLKKETIALTPAAFDILYKASDTLEVMLADIDSKQKRILPADLTHLVKSLEAISRATATTPKFSFTPMAPAVADVPSFVSAPEMPIIEIAADEIQPPKNKKEGTEDELQIGAENFQKVNVPEKNLEKSTDKASDKPSDRETVRVATSKLYNLLRQAEEMIAVKSTLAHYVSELQVNANRYAAWSRKSSNSKQSFSVTRNNESAQDVLAFLEREKDFRKLHEEELFGFEKKMAQFQRVASRMIDDLLLDIKTTLLHPFSSLLGIVPKIVRDLSKEYGKDIDLQIEGSEIEIDRRILEEIKDPLIHLIRNCIDHGIELPQSRIKAGKASKGILKIEIRQDSDRNITLRISDDGSGIHRDNVISSAIKSGIIKPNEADALSDKEVSMLIFRSGVSTSPFITDISGRGLGMAIVVEKVIKLGGTVSLDTIPGAGSAITMVLPQTLAIFKGILIQASGQFFIIPTISVIKAIRIHPADILTVESKKAITFNNETLALVSLSDVLNLPLRRSKKNTETLTRVLVIAVAQKKMAFTIDEVLGEHEGMIKDLGPQLQHVTNIAGATLLGDGRIVPILHIPELFDSASRSSLPMEFASGPALDSTKEDVQQKNILVAEDSITIRSMLRNFLETAGYAVKTAVDGLQAHGYLQHEKFDLVVSDIEMPHMTGFELTAKIREDKNLADMPIVLVTALESPDDRQRGMDLGANAYVVKSSFEQSNLIEIIRRLI